MIDQTKIAIRASTQEHLDIEDIKDGIIVLKDGGACLVLATTAINFGLLSEEEQEATIYTYAALLNSLTFSVQIVIRSSLKDISSYLKLLEEAEFKEGRKLIKEQINKYRKFIQETVQKNNVLDKKFFLIIPMSSLEMGATKTLTASFSRKKGLPFNKEYILERAKVNLSPKRDHLLRQLARLGLKTHQLDTQELIKLFFDIYNPELTGQQVAEAEQYQTPMVQSPMKAPLEPTTTVPSEPLQVDKPAQETKIEAPQEQEETEENVSDQESIQNQIKGLVKESVKE